MINAAALARLNTLLATLKVQAQVIDKENSQAKAHRLLADSSLFSENLFHSYSDKFSDYINEVEKKLASLTRLINAGKALYAVNEIALVEQQISSLVNALHANKTMHDEAQLRLTASKKRNFKKAAKSIMQSSHQLHQKLAEHHEFERRLAEMITDREQLLAQSTPHKQQIIAQEVLALHQRLGRCRQAISKIERSIEMSEKRFTR